MSKKSQITLFIILGVVMLFIIGSLYNFAFTKQDDQNTAKVVASRNLAQKREEYQRFVMQCVEDSAREAIYLVGKQGGVIYDYQAEGTKTYYGPPNYYYGDYVLPLKDVTGIIFNVSYGITNPENDNYHPPPPMYPYGMTRLVSDPTTINPLYSNTLGNTPKPGPFTPLCDYNGLNGPTRVGDFISCQSYDSTSEFIHSSVQEYIEAYIEDSTEACADFSVFKELHDSKITKGKAEAKTIFSDESINVEVSYPINITSYGGAGTINLDKIAVSINTRLKQIHEFASHLIEREVNDIFFNAISDAPTLNNCRSKSGGTTQCMKSGMSVSKFTNPCLKSGLCPESGIFDDIITITDESYHYKNKLYTFQFAVQNRPPALDLLRQQPLRQSNYYNKDFDYQAYVGENITIEPYGYDPDEEGHNSRGFMDAVYAYSMWKEDYNDIHNLARCNQSRSYQELCAANPDRVPEVYTQDNLDQPHSWSTSEDYLDTGRIAKYQVDWADIGLHHLKVDVCDSEGLCDYQVLRVLVEVNLTGT